MILSEIYNEVRSLNKNSSLFYDLSLITNIDTLKSIECRNLSDMKTCIKYYEEFEFPSITCGIITYNEERFIERCLESVHREFDEFILLDSYSSDRTVTIVNNKFPEIKIYFEKWVEDFSHHRNKIINIANGDWIYFIDADNYYDKNNYGKAHRVAKLLTYLGIDDTVLSPLTHEHNGHINYDNPRLFSLKKNIHFHGKVHEEPMLENKKIPVNLNVDINIYHDGYNSQIINLQTKHKRNLLLTKEMTISEPNNPKWYYFLGREIYLHDSNTSDAKKYLNQALKLYKQDYNKSHYLNAIVLLCRIYLQTNDLSNLEKLLVLLDEKYPNCSDSTYFKASLLWLDLNQKTESIMNYLHEEFESDSYSAINSGKEHIIFLILQLNITMNNWESVKTSKNLINSSDLKTELQNQLNNIEEQISSLKKGL
ncbi:SunS family peptide S-glycosyltransferase [Salibacterium salarium]|uniref:SunS family peptide S-glycosyltransferase n=1 Tax=Salibacterium salarium TaxID=284579 RepID=A0A428MS80_9BACI|nr:SunS family peptide S-glycosyltransferase [Salibacterium salarium]RSL29001.1 SunS family peptide S-glycosyltransferase [Salibacterium salarium]